MTIHGFNTNESDNAEQTLAGRMAWFDGRAPIVRRYNSNFVPASFPITTSVAPEKRVAYSFKADATFTIANIAAGTTAVRTRFKSFVESIPAGWYVVLTYYHEVNDDIRGGTITATQFKDAYSVFRQELDAATLNTGVTVKLACNFMAYRLTDTPTYFDDSWVPPPTVCHLLTFDNYGNPGHFTSSTGSNKYGAATGTGYGTTYPDPVTRSRDMFAIIQRTGYASKWGILEYNSPTRDWDASEAGKAAWHQDLLAHWMAPPLSPSTPPEVCVLWEAPSGTNWDQRYGRLSGNPNPVLNKIRPYITGTTDPAPPPAGTTPSVRATALIGDNGAAATSTFTGTIPAGAVAGDVALLCAVQGTGANTLTTPTGWTLLSGPQRVDSNNSAYLFAKKLVSGDAGATVTLTWSGSGLGCGVIQVWQAADTVAELVSAYNAQASPAATSLTMATVSTPEADCGVAHFAVARVAAATALNLTWPAAYTEAGEADTANATANFTVSGAYLSGGKAVAGATGGDTVTSSATPTGAHMFAVALTPAAAPVGAPTANAGPDQLNVDPGTTVTLTGTDTGTITARTWTQTAGAPVTLTVSPPATATFKAPGVAAPGWSGTFEYAVTAASGTASDTVTVTASPLSLPAPPDEPASPPVVDGPSGPTLHTWAVFARDPGYAPSMGLPIKSLSVSLKHMGVSRAVLSTPFSPEAHAALAPGCGLLAYRDGRLEFSGAVEERHPVWTASDGSAVLTVSCAGDEVVLEDRITFPDATRADDDQTVSGHWVSGNVPTSTAMLQLIQAQAGSGAHASRRVPGLIAGDDPGVGPLRVWKVRFTNVLQQLGTMAKASGADLGLRVLSEPGSLVASIYQPENRSAYVRFSADLSNLAGFDFTEKVPEVTNVVVGGGGTLATRVHRATATTEPLATRWGRKRWQYVDRRDTTVTAELDAEAGDAIAEGIADMVSLGLTVTDTPGTSYGTGYNLGDAVTVYVGLPGAEKVGTVVDAVREVLFTVDEDGREDVHPVVGSFDAQSQLPTATQRRLARVARAVGGLVTNQ